MRTGFRIIAAMILLSPISSDDSQHDVCSPAGTREGVNAYACRNGLRVLLLPDDSRDTITVNMTYFVGSRNEVYGQTGMAHLIEHLLPGAQTGDDGPPGVENLAGNANAETGVDSTAYYETFAASSDNLQLALDLEAYRMRRVCFTSQRLTTEISIVRNEANMDENNPGDALTERLFATAFRWHNYRNSIFGSASDLANVSPGQVRKFYDYYYQPDNAVLILSGKFDSARALGYIEEKLGKIPRPDRVLPRTHTEEPPQDGPRSAELRRTGSVKLIHAGYHIPSVSHPDFAPLQILCRVLAATPDGSLYRALVQQKSATRVFGYAPQMRDPGLAIFGATAGLDARGLDPSNAMLAVLEDAGNRRFTEHEVARERTSAVNRMNALLRSTQDFALQIGDWEAAGDWRLFFVHRERLRRVVADDLTRVARKYLRQSNRTVVELIPDAQPQRVSVPPAPPVAAVLAGIEYQRPPVFSGKRIDRSPRRLETRSTRSRLTSGLNVVLLPKQTRGRSVHVRLNLRFGNEQTSMKRYWTGYLAARMIGLGTERKSREQIQDELIRAEARFKILGAADSATATLATTRPNLIPCMRLLGEMAQQPVFRPDDFEHLRDAEITVLKNYATDPEYIAFNSLSRALHSYPAEDVRQFRSVEEDIVVLGRITLADVEQFYRESYGASHGELAVVGDFDATELRAVAEEVFGAWRSPATFSPIARRYLPVKPLEHRIEVPDRQNSVFAAGLAIPISQDSDDYPAMLIGAYILGSGSMNSRLFNRIRQQEGLSYSVETVLSGSVLDTIQTLVTTVETFPWNIDRVEAAFRQEVQRAIDTGFTAEEVESAKKSWLEQERIRRTDDGELARLLAADVFAGRSQEWTEKLWLRVGSLTPETVSEAVRRYISPSAFSIVIAGDLNASNFPRGEIGSN